MNKMQGAIWPGNSIVELKEFEIPKPGHVQVLIRTKATTTGGGVISCIYRELWGISPLVYIMGLCMGVMSCWSCID